jgi:hypothetical protein
MNRPKHVVKIGDRYLPYLYHFKNSAEAELKLQLQRHHDYGDSLTTIKVVEFIEKDSLVERLESALCNDYSGFDMGIDHALSVIKNEVGYE